MSERALETPAAAETGPSTALVTVLAVAAGALVANLYYAQPLVSSIGPAIGVGPDIAGSVVSVTQVGYGLGLFFLVSLSDLVENRKLVLVMLAITAASLAGMALSTTALPFFATALLIGLCSTAAQVLVPFVAHLVPLARRGRVVGNVMAGVLAGIMLARPVALFVSASFGWRAMFWLSALMMVAIGLAVARMMPRHQPAGGLHYGGILASMAGVIRAMPALRWRAAYQALLFGAFNMFWTAAPLMLAERFGLSEHGIALFALAGAGGALSAPFAGRLADRGLGRVMTAGAMASLGLCFYATGWAAGAGQLALLVIFAVVIDAAVQVNQIVSQRIIFSAAPETRGRVNAIYMTVTFVGGAAGSMLSTIVYHWGGWQATATIGGLIGAAALLLFCLEGRRA